MVTLLSCLIFTQFEIPAGMELKAKPGDLLGWLDTTGNGIGYSETGTDSVCRKVRNLINYAAILLLMDVRVHFGDFSDTRH